MKNMTVPVVDKNHKQMMPTIASRARRAVRTGDATPFFNEGGEYCVRLNREPSDYEIQKNVYGIDSGSHEEGLNMTSEAHIFKNIHSQARTGIKEKKKDQKNLRKARRYRKTPYRKQRTNRKKSKRKDQIPPSTKSRWDLKIAHVRRDAKVYPIAEIVIEDIAAKTKGQPKWDKNFSPLEVGKKYAYAKLSEIAPVKLLKGWETAEIREKLGLKKNKKRGKIKPGEDVFARHCVDAFCLAYWGINPDTPPREIDNKDVYLMEYIPTHRRNLHFMAHNKKGERVRYGGTMSHGFKKGCLVKHPKYGLAYVGGFLDETISLHDVGTGKRLTQDADPEDCKFIAYNKWRWKVLKG